MLICRLTDGVLSAPEEHGRVFGVHASPTVEDLARSGYVRCTYVVPNFDPLTQIKEACEPYLLDGEACLVQVRAMTESEIESKKAEAMALLRAERNAKLAACDFTQLPDYPGNDTADWVIYRQALRDLPQNTADARLGVTWPNPPNA